MDFESKNKNWLTPLLRWLSGDATRHDEQSLDTLATDDPFLADALDGYRSQPASNHAAAVTRLKANLRRRTRKQRGAGFYLLRVAAIGTVLVAAWFVFRQFDQSKTMQADGMDMTQQAAESPTAELAPAPSAEAEEPEGLAEVRDKISSSQTFSKKKSETPDAPPVKDNLAFAEAETPIAQPAPSALQAPGVFAEEKIVATDSAVELAEASDDILPKKELAEAQKRVEENAKSDNSKAAKSKKTESAKPSDAAALNAPQRPVNQPITITGKVTDESDEPLIGVNVLAKGTNTGAITDFDGNYSINVPADASSLQFAYTGYTTLEVKLNEENRLNVQLGEISEALSEVVVTGYSQPKERRVVSPKPKGGFKKFEKYLRKNMRRPDAAAPSQVSGIVSVRFRILPNGKLADFQPTSSLGQEFKDEAVRLLREGPKWKGEPDSLTNYSIRF